MYYQSVNHSKMKCVHHTFNLRSRALFKGSSLCGEELIIRRVTLTSMNIHSSLTDQIAAFPLTHMRLAFFEVRPPPTCN